MKKTMFMVLITFCLNSFAGGDEIINNDACLRLLEKIAALNEMMETLSEFEYTLALIAIGNYEQKLEEYHNIISTKKNEKIKDKKRRTSF